MRKKKKGQYLIIEDVVLFGIGVAIIAGIAGVFLLVNDSIKDEAKSYQYMEVGMLAKANMQSYELTGATGQLRFAIPQDIAGEAYTITSASKEGKTFIVVGPESGDAAEIESPYPMSGRISGLDKMLLDYQGSIVRIRGSGV